MKGFQTILSFFILSLFFIQNSTNAFCQLEVPAGAFVKLNNDSLLLGKILMYDSKIIGASTIDLDNRIIKSKQVNYFGIGTSYFYARVPSKGLVEPTHKSKNFYFFRVIIHLMMSSTIVVFRE